MKRLYTTIALLSVVVAMTAQTVSKDAALAKAARYFSAQRDAAARQAADRQPEVTATQLTTAYTAEDAGETYYYVINNPAGGFVIIGGDEVAHEVLGYSEHGTFDYAAAPDNMKWWLSTYSREISQAIKAVKAGKLDVTAMRRATQRTASARAEVPNMLAIGGEEIVWGQGSPYNSQLPTLGEGYSALVTGCVATAAAQIMRTWQCPATHGTGSYSYQQTWKVTDGDDITLTFEADYANAQYDWTNMLPKYTDGSYTDEEAEAVGTLMYHVGVGAKMSYGVGASGTRLGDMGMAYHTYFGYDKGIRMVQRNGYTDSDWDELMYQEMDSGRPVQYGSATTKDENGKSSGHSFVISGYTEQTQGEVGFSAETPGYYINWGWNGYYNGWFPMTATVSGVKPFTPDGTGTGGGAAGDSYDQSQMALIGIQPDQGNSLAKNWFCEREYALSATTATTGTSVTLSGGFYSSTLANDVNHSIGVRMVGDDATYDVPGLTASVNMFYGYTSYSFTVPQDVADHPGTYKVYPIYKDENGEWQLMEYLHSQTIPELTVAAATGLVLTQTPDFGNDGYTVWDDDVTANNAQLSLKLLNNSDAAIENHTLTVFIYSTSDSNSLTYYAKTFSLAAGASMTMDLSKADIASPSSLTAGTTYTIYVEDYTDQTELLAAYNVYFTPVAKLDISYTMSAAGWGTICLPYEASVPDGLTAYSVRNVSGSELVLDEVTDGTLCMNTPYLVSGTEGSYAFAGPTTPEGTYTDGLLTGVTKTGAYATAGSFVLQNKSGKLGFYEVASDASQPMKQYRAYMKRPANAGSDSYYYVLPGQTGIDDVNADDVDEGSSTRKVMRDGRLVIVTPTGAYSPDGTRIE